MTQRIALNDGLTLVFQGIERLITAFPGRRFTIDGRRSYCRVGVRAQVA